MSDSLQVLLFEDNPGDADLIMELLPNGATTLDVKCVARLSEALECVDAQRFDLALLDLGLPDSDGLATLRTLRRQAEKLPIIVLTGNDDEQTGLDAIREGAQDYLIKGQTDKNLLTRSIKYAVQRKQAENALKELNDTLEQRIVERTAQITSANETLQIQIDERNQAEEALRRTEKEWERTFASVPDLIATLDKRHRFLRVNDAMARRLGLKPEECVGLHSYQVIHGTSAPPEFCPHSRTMEDGREHCEELHVDRFDGDFLVTTTPLLDETGESIGSVHIARDITEKKRMEDALRKNEERYHILFETMTEGFALHEMITDDQGRPCDYRFLDMNPAFEQLTGLKRADLIGKRVSDVMPDIEYYWIENYGQVALTGEPLYTEHCSAALKNWYEVSAFRTAPGHFAVIFSDITERKTAEQELLHSEERYHTLFDKLMEGFCIIEVLFDEHDRPIDYRFLEINPRFEALTGLRNAQGKLMRDLAPEHETHWFDIYGKVALTGEPARFVNQAIALNRWYDVSAYRIGGAESRRVAILFNDISDAKRAEEALRESELRFRTMVNAMPQLAWIARADGHISWYNQRWYDYTGTVLEEMEGWGWRSVHDPAELPRVLERWQASIATGEPFEMIFPLRGADGVFRPFLTRGIPLKDAAGHVLLWLGTNTDVSEQKRVEEAVTKINRELEDRVAERTKVLAATVANLEIEIEDREKAEESLLRLNRLYLVLSETNQAIIRANDRDTLFDDFCRIAVEDGGFKLAWVGLADEESGALKVVKVVASAGATSYLDDIIITAKDAAWQGPTAISIREGSYYICNDFLGAAITAPWHERGLIHGIRASASIPMKQEGRVIGALSLYADEKDFFDIQQVGLLKQMGADFSFALDNIVRETRRLEAERALREETAERLRAVDALREKEQMLIQQNRQAAMGEMIGNIAHQWRQPLNNLGLLVQQTPLLYKFGEVNEEFLDNNARKSMEYIQHMSRTIDDFRNFFKIDKEKVEFKVHEEVANTLSLMEGSFQGQQIGIVISAEVDPVILGYPNEFSQVLLNILINARDALIEREVVKPKILITIGTEGNRAFVTVADNAGGIPEEIIDKIFDPYFTTKGPQAGTGGGLFMSKTIIEKNMGGLLTVRNVEGGAEFKIQV